MIYGSLCSGIPYRGKPADRCPDGPRYKALGNSMAVNVMSWIGERIALVDAMEAAGVCQAHLHSSKCLCGNCPQNRGQRPGTQTVMVREAPGCSWGQAVAAPVTLPRAPWEESR